MNNKQQTNATTRHSIGKMRVHGQLSHGFSSCFGSLRLTVSNRWWSNKSKWTVRFKLNKLMSSLRAVFVYFFFTVFYVVRYSHTVFSSEEAATRDDTGRHSSLYYQVSSIHRHCRSLVTCCISSYINDCIEENGEFLSRKNS